MGRWETRCSLVPWWLPDSDLCEANGGEVELERHLVVDGHRETHLGLHVWGQADDAPSLGILAIRCQREGSHDVPLTLSIPETPIVFEHRDAYVMVQSNPRRPHGYGAVRDTGED